MIALPGRVELPLQPPEGRVLSIKLREHLSSLSGKGEIRTRVGLSASKVFETWPFNRSGTFPICVPEQSRTVISASAGPRSIQLSYGDNGAYYTAK